MNLSALMPSAGRLQLTHPTQGKLDIFLNVVGQDSKQFRDTTTALMKERLSAINASENEKVDRVASDNARLVASCIVGWSDEEAFGPYSPQRAKELMSMPELGWIREEVEAFITERSNFFCKADGKA